STNLKHQIASQWTMNSKSSNGSPIHGLSNRARKDSTLLDLGKLISSAYPQVSRANTRLSFRLIYGDTYRPRVLLKDVGTVLMTPGSEGEDAGSKTLDDV